MIGGFQVGPFQLAYQQGTRAVPPQRFKGKGYRPEFVPNRLDRQVELVPEPTPKEIPLPVELEVVAVSAFTLGAGAEVSFGAVADAVITLPSLLDQFSTWNHVQANALSDVVVAAGGEASHQHMHEIGVYLDASSDAETEYTPASARPLTDEEIAIMLGKLV